jgi:outer membrane protein insertion porin family
VFISNPSVPTPPPLEEVLGQNFLSTVRLSLVHDTRDSSFIPGKGHFIEASYEQGIADFHYPRAELDARQYFTLRERPDGGNRHIFSTVAQIGWMDNGAPIFEKFFAGGFQSFRGFAFYGVTPQELGVRVGGRWQGLGTLEYMLPVTADDTIQLVTFTDMGTVQDNVSFSKFRLTVGGGVRLTIPAMGPMPIAVDFGVPILQQDFDNKQLVAFYMGVQR